MTPILKFGLACFFAGVAFGLVGLYGYMLLVRELVRRTWLR